MLHTNRFRAVSARTSRAVFESMEDRRLFASGPIIFGAGGQDLATSVATDTAGNIYVAGSFQGTVDMDPSAATRTLTSAGARSVFVAKYSAAGKYLWAKRLGGLTAESDHDGILGLSGKIAVDSAGAVYVTGAFSGKRDFDPGAGTCNLTSAGKTDAFVAKLSSSGAFVWAKRIGGTAYEKGLGLALDKNKNVLLTGYFSGSVDFDPGAGTTKLTSLGGHDAFVAKFTSAGAFTWARRFGSKTGDAGEWGWGVASDATGNVYICGMFTGTATLTPSGTSVKMVSAGDADVFVGKLTAAGAPVWGVRVGSTGADVATDLVVDSAGYVYVTGVFEGKVDFNPAATATANLTSAGGADAFILKLTNAGKYVKAMRYGSRGGDAIWDIATRSGSLYVAGMFSGQPTYGSTPAGESAGGDDLFVAKLKTSDLSVVWGHSDGDVEDDWVLGVAVDTAGNVIGAGFVGGGTNFDLHDDPDLLSGGDIVVGKLTASGT